MDSHDIRNQVEATRAHLDELAAAADTARAKAEEARVAYAAKRNPSLFAAAQVAADLHRDAVAALEAARTDAGPLLVTAQTIENAARYSELIAAHKAKCQTIAEHIGVIVEAEAIVRAAVEDIARLTSSGETDRREIARLEADALAAGVAVEAVLPYTPQDAREQVANALRRALGNDWRSAASMAPWINFSHGGI